MRLLDVLGPIMIGPSSSHTAGAARLGKLARTLLGERPVKALITLHGSFAATGEGHGTDLALIGGILGFDADDERIRNSYSHAQEQGLEFVFAAGDLGDVHPNTARIELEGETGKKVSIMGSSIGGGKVEVTEIDGLKVSLTGEKSTLVATYPDRPGVAASITSIFASRAVNIASMRITRTGRGKAAICIIECDTDIPQDIVDFIAKLPGIDRAIKVPAS